MKTILIIDDHPIVLEGISSVLTPKGYKVLKATGALQAMEILSHVRPVDMIVCDLSLEGGTDGLNLIGNIRKLDIPRTPAIVYTMHEELWMISALLKADVDGVVLKGDDINELVEAIESVAAGKTYRSAAFDERRTEALTTTGLLSGKDIEVLRRLAQGQSNRDISDEMGISQKSIEYHRANILRKLNCKSMPEAVGRAFQIGMIYTLALLLSVFTAGAENLPEPKCVDLGLSVEWADANLGASSPSESGGYYAFGEAFTKESYHWDTYTHCDEADMSMIHDFGTDNISATEYDAAHVLLGNGWRMPTVDEFSELIENCTQTSAPGGVAFTAPNGNSIFIPACGYMNQAKVVHSGSIYLSTANCETETEEWEGIVYRMTNNFVFYANETSALPGVISSVQLGLPVRPVRTAGEASVRPEVADPAEAPAEYYTLQGVRVEASSLTPGLYILRRSSTSRLVRF